MNNIFRKYLLPGFVFQSVVIGGGYATGRELVEFFFPSGPVGGMLAMLVATIVWSITMMLSFEVARMAKAYDYRTFFTQTIGKGWVLFELAYFALLLLIMSTLGAASGELVSNNLGVAPEWGSIGLMVTIGILVFFGSSVIEKFLAGWSFLLYGAYAAFVIWCFSAFGDKISAGFSSHSVEGNWVVGGLRYAGYNLAVLPAVLFCIRHISTRKEAFTAGILAGPIAMIPAALFFIAMVGYYPEIQEQSLPVQYLLNIINVPAFGILFQVILFGTFIETGTAMIHSVNERIAEVYTERGKEMPQWLRPIVALGMLLTAIVLASKIGLVGLIAQGYGTLTWVFIVLIVVPLLTVGIWKIRKAKTSTGA